MSEIFSLISWSNIQLLPGWMQLAGAAILVLTVVQISRNLMKREWLQVARGLIGSVVILVFMSVWGQVYLGMTLNHDLMYPDKRQTSL